MVMPKTVWHVPSHNSQTNGSLLLKKVIGENRFNFPKSLYAVHDVLRFFVANKPNALIVDFFAGSGTTLHAVNLLNAEDGGSRRCIMVTNNEVSADEATALSAQGFQPGDDAWEKLGIARYVNWPRTKCSIQGVDVNGNPISGEYLTTCKQTVEIDRKITQIVMDGDSMSIDAKKSIISLLEKSKIPQNVLTKNSNYILGEDYTTSILFNLEYMDEWLEALEEHTQVAEIYIVTDKKPVFNQIKARIKETLGTISKEEPVKFPMSDGFKANAAFFKLGFLDKNAVALGHQFKEILSTLWMKAGAIGACPAIEATPEDMLILPKNSFAVLLDETMFNEFADKMQEYPNIKTIYFITDSDKSFRDMSNQFANTTTYQLYRDYLDNFRINIGR
jgi:adenine-specific DNA-methyltransferase